MNREKDYYQVLGVSPKANSNEIRRAYHHLAILNHPDRNPSVQATLRMQEINEAYSILGEKRKRSKYDSERNNFTTGSQTTSAPQKTTPATNLQQIFAKDVTWRIVFLPLPIAIVVLMISIQALIRNVRALWSVPELIDYWDWRPTISPLFLVVLSSIYIGSILLLWLRSSKSREFEAQCPKCGKPWAAEKLSEKPIGVSQRYKIHYKCKYCFYEWQFIKTKRQSIL
jgi:hypothetical protein